MLQHQSNSQMPVGTGGGWEIIDPSLRLAVSQEMNFTCVIIPVGEGLLHGSRIEHRPRSTLAGPFPRPHTFPFSILSPYPYIPPVLHQLSPHLLLFCIPKNLLCLLHGVLCVSDAKPCAIGKVGVRPGSNFGCGNGCPYVLSKGMIQDPNVMKEIMAQRN